MYRYILKESSYLIENDKDKCYYKAFEKQNTNISFNV